MKKIYWTVCLLLVATGIFAQEESEEFIPVKYPMFLGISGNMLLPHGDFGDKMLQPGYGGQIQYLINLNQSPIYLGVQSSIANFGNEVLDFTDPEGFELKWKTNSSLWSSHLKLHLEPPVTIRLQPYVSGQVGFNHFFTVSRLVDPNLEDNRTLERYVDDNDWTWSYGGSAGVLLPLDKDWLTMLNLSASYWHGGISSFYSKREEYSIMEDTIEAFSLEESVINTFGFNIGVLIYLP